MNCNSSEPGQEPAELKTAAGELAVPGCSTCLDIHLDGYNLFLLEDYSGGHNIAGKVAAGGNITLEGFSVGAALPDDNVSNTLVAGGNLHITNGSVSGAAWYGDSYTPNPNWSVNFHRGTAAQGTPIDFVAEFAELRSLSSRLAAQPANGTVRREAWGALTLTGTDPCLNVFRVDASDFTGTSQRNIFVPAGSFALVNIHGTGSTLSGGFNEGLNPRRVLYNFVDAVRIDARGFGWPGTVLAPHARVTLNEGGWSGGLYAISLSGGASGQLQPLDDVAGEQAEVCNGVDDNCDGATDEGFECTGSASRSCTAWCGAEGTQSCNQATCGYGECTSESCCRADSDCEGGFYCEGSLCVAQSANGAACGSANQCASGQCVDGVCCDTACEGECNACNVTGQVGTCSPLPSTVQCRGSAGECDVAEFCTGTGASCPADGFQRAGEACTADSNTCTGDVCDGNGSCGHPVLPADTSCNDGNASTTGDRCDGAGVCTGCGDGARNGSEACDDGNIITETSCSYGTASCTACNATCTAALNLTGAYCGDAARNGSETCDDGNTTTETSCPYGTASCTACNATCTAALNLTGAYCGDAARNGSETCDDGNTTTETSCPYGTASCTRCNATCTAALNLTGAYCSDGVRNGSEACDDGNTTTETSCPNGQASCTACNATCTAVLNITMAYCGDGVRNGSEVCDDGNTTTETSCPYGQASCIRCNATCTVALNLTGPYCGDWVRNGGEVCDDGNTVTETECPYGQATCTACNGTCSTVLHLTGEVPPPSGCSARAVNWSQSHPSWHGFWDPNPTWTYTCSGNLPAAHHGGFAQATWSSTDRSGSAQYECVDGSWVRRSASCDGNTVSTSVETTCSGVPGSDRDKWITWYREDLKRCADVAGLNWWLDQYTNNRDCTPADNYRGYGSKDACWRAQFRLGANSNGNSYNEAQATGHISSWDENTLCGSLAYTWTNVSAYGRLCKYRP